MPIGRFFSQSSFSLDWILRAARQARVRSIVAQYWGRYHTEWPSSSHTYPIYLGTDSVLRVDRGHSVEKRPAGEKDGWLKRGGREARKNARQLLRSTMYRIATMPPPFSITAREERAEKKSSFQEFLFGYLGELLLIKRWS